MVRQQLALKHAHCVAPGLLSQEQRAVWDDANNPTPLMRRMRAAMRSAPWLLHLAARVSETQLGGRVLYERVLKPAAGAWRTLGLSSAAPGPNDISACRGYTGTCLNTPARNG